MTRISIAAALVQAKHAPAAPISTAVNPSGGPSNQLACPNAKSPEGVADAAGLHPDFTFDRFIEGRANRHARAVASSFAGNPYSIRHPLCIYGAVGLGKTHLMQAIGHMVLAQDRHARVKYVHVEDFFGHVVRAFQTGTVDSFRECYASLDVLLLDDIQFLKRKERTRMELLLILDSLAQRDRLIVMTGDCPPQDWTEDWTDERELAAWNPDLLSRIHYGQPVNLLSPNLELRKNCLTAWKTKEGVALGDDVVRYVARRMRSGNMRDLEGAWNRIVAWSAFYNQQVSLQVARPLLADFG